MHPPVHYAVGVQSKVLEAMAMGTPVVCSVAAFAGLDAPKGEEVLVADDPEAFAARVLRVCLDPALARRLSAAGKRYVGSYHSWGAQAGKLVTLYELATV
jgi:glycosyltransferase involved in cell wall biosynthesis